MSRPCRDWTEKHAIYKQEQMSTTPQAHYERLKMAAEFRPDGRLSVIPHETLIWAYEQVEKWRMAVDMDADWQMPVCEGAALPEAGEERE